MIHSYICHFSRINGVSCSTYENVLCKIYSLSKTGKLLDKLRGEEEDTEK